MKNKPTHSSLTRKDIENYLSLNREDQAKFESQVIDQFELSALKGYKNSGLTSLGLTKVDQRFKTKSNSIGKTLLFSALAILLISGFVGAYKLGEHQSSKKAEDQKVAIRMDKTDVQIIERIDTMQMLPKADQLIPESGTQKKVELEKLKSENKTTNDQLDVDYVIPFPKVTLEPLPVTIVKREVSISKQKQAKEVYIQDFKAIDYRAYREKPSVQIEQIILTGTPANIETENGEPVENTFRTVDIPYMDYLEKTMVQVNRGRWKQALQRFQEILISYPDDVNARFYAGFCYYNLKQYNDACTSFAACLQLEYSNFNEEANWYLAQSRLAKGDKTGAKELFVEIRDQKGYYGKQADKILKTM